MTKDMTDVQELFTNMEEQIFELNYTVYKDNMQLADKLNRFVVQESNIVMEMIREPWETYNETVIESFKKLNEPNLSIRDHQHYLKEALQNVAPKNLVDVLNQIFHSPHLEIIKKRYDNVFNHLLQNNGFTPLLERYRISNHQFAAFYSIIMNESKELTEPIQRLSKNYMKLLETLKDVKTNGDDELFIFGAGLLGSLFAGPIGGMATRSILRSSNSKEAKINQVIEKIYLSLENFYNELELTFIRIHKKLAFYYFTIYFGLVARFQKDIQLLGYELTDIHIRKKQLIISLNEEEKHRITSWYFSIQEEIVDHLKNKNYKEADLISQHLLQFFSNNLYVSNIKHDKYTLGYYAAILRYHVLTSWLQQMVNIDFTKENESKIMNGYRFYSKLFNDMNIGVRGIENIGDMKVPTLLETVIHYLHLTERIASKLPEKAFQLRTNTINSLLEYLVHFSEKRAGRDVLAFSHECVDTNTLQCILAYQQFLKSIQITTVTSQILKRTTPSVEYKSLRRYYEQFISETNWSESIFYSFLQSQSQLDNVNAKNNRDLFIVKSGSAVIEESTSEEHLKSVLLLFSFLRYRECIYKGELENTDEGVKKWQQIWNKKVEYLQRYVDAKLGNAESQYILAGMYMTGTGVEVNEKESFYWFMEAAKQNYPDAVKMIPLLYWKGTGVEANPQESFKWAKKCAFDFGTSEDQVMLGKMYLEGYGTTINYQEAYDWFMKAASQGDAEAMFELGRMVEQGQAVPINREDAKKWYRKSAEKGHEEAKKCLVEIETEERKARNRKISFIIFPIAALSMIAYLFATSVYIPKTNYEKAKELLLDEKYVEAIPILKELEDYEDSALLLEEAENEWRYIQAIEDFENGYYDSAMSSFSYLEDYKDSRELYVEAKYLNAKQYLDSEYYEAAKDFFGELGDYKDSNELIQIAEEALYLDAMEKLENKQYNEARKALFKVINYKDARKRLHELNNLVAQDIGPVARGYRFTLTLHDDGTVTGEGDNDFGKISVDHWENIVQGAAGSDHSVGLKADGTVTAVGFDHFGQLDVGSWENIVEIAAGRNHTVGLTADGDVKIAGSDTDDTMEIYRWDDIVAIAADWETTIGLKADGTVLVVGENIDLSHWEEIIDISINIDEIIGLKSDGTVLVYER